MKKILASILCICLTSCGGDKEAEMPTAKKVPTEIKLDHGGVINDDYAWMHDANWPGPVKDQKIMDHLRAENAYIDSFFADVKENTDKLFEEIKGRIKLADVTVPVKKDDYYYYSRIEENMSYPVYCRKKGNMEANEEIILDLNELASNQKYMDVGAISVSHDHRYLAFAVNFTGDEKYTIKVLDLQHQQSVPDTIENTKGDIVWHKDIPGFFYAPMDSSMRCFDVNFHKLGTQNSEDQNIYHEKDHRFFVSLGQTNSREYLVIDSSTPSENESYIVPLGGDNFALQLVKERRDGITYSTEHNGNHIYILTNDQGPNFRLARSHINDLDEALWKNYIPIDDDRYLSSFDVTRDYFILNYKVKGLPQIKVLNIKDSTAKIVKFPDESFTAYGYSTNFDENDIRIDYSSLIRPRITYAYNFSNATKSILKEKEVLGDYNHENYQVKRLWAKNDDVKVPISLFYKKDKFKADGTNPLYLTGYGSYGIAYPPRFRSDFISLADRGFVVAIAHVRGGDDLGYKWYEDAKLLDKKNTFEDFIASAEHLVEEGYTSSGNIAIQGGSAGGMLVGVAMNMRPELFKAVIANSPSIDTLGKLLDSKIMGTPYHYRELGNPEEKEYFDYIASYSPYENVRAANYPNVYTNIGTSDPRVPYSGALKWASKLREHNKDKKSVILVRSDINAGHFGASDRFKALREYAEQYMFLFKTFGIEK